MLPMLSMSSKPSLKGRVSNFSKNILENWVKAEYQNKLVANQQKWACLLMIWRREPSVNSRAE